MDRIAMALRRRRTRLVVIVLLAAVCCYTFYPPPIVIRGWEPGRSRWLPELILPDQDTTLLEAKVCERSPKILIVVLSAVNNFLQRAAIRDTWASARHPSYAIVFLLGVDMENDGTQELVEEEYQKHRDIIQEDFVDAYENLTLKSAMMLKQLVRRCHTTSYLLKVDDDVFLHTENLVKLTKQLDSEPERNFMVGHLSLNEHPHTSRFLFRKWACPEYMYEGPFPPFLSGASGYLMTRQTAVKLFETALKEPILHLEDVFFAGIVAQRANITLRDHEGFIWMYGPEEVCSYTSELIKNLIVSHKISHVGLHRIWKWIRKKTLTDSTSDCYLVQIAWGHFTRLLQLS